MDEIIKKIEAMKVMAQKVIVKEPQDILDEIANDISEGYITACDEIMQFVNQMIVKKEDQCYIGDNCEMQKDGRCQLGCPCPHQKKHITI